MMPIKRENIVDEIPMYFQEICTKYHLRSVKLPYEEVAFIGAGYALLLALGREHVSVYYLYEERRKIVKYSCRNYFALVYDDEDRQNLLDEDEADDRLRNDIHIAAQGILHKWEPVLQGEREWLAGYRRSAWFSEVPVQPHEKVVADMLLEQKK